MADVVVTLKIMPESPETNLADIEAKSKEFVTSFGGEVGKVEEVPVAFGLKALNILFVMDENKGSTDALEEQISGVEGVNSVDVTDVRRTIG
jgi:elongation factor 1-beta